MDLIEQRETATLTNKNIKDGIQLVGIAIINEMFVFFVLLLFFNFNLFKYHELCVGLQL